MTSYPIVYPLPNGLYAIEADPCRVVTSTVSIDLRFTDFCRADGGLIDYKSKDGWYSSFGANCGLIYGKTVLGWHSSFGMECVVQARTWRLTFESSLAAHQLERFAALLHGDDDEQLTNEMSPIIETPDPGLGSTLMRIYARRMAYDDVILAVHVGTIGDHDDPVLSRRIPEDTRGPATSSQTFATYGRLSIDDSRAAGTMMRRIMRATMEALVESRDGA
jgi:hypothetical protein